MNEPEKFKQILGTRIQNRYYPAHVVADRLSISSHGISKLTSAFMVLSKDGSKVNIGLSLKFESKGLKVMDYTRKEGKGWEYSDKAMNLIHEYKVREPLRAICLALTDIACSKHSRRYSSVSTSEEASWMCYTLSPFVDAAKRFPASGRHLPG